MKKGSTEEKMKAFKELGMDWRWDPGGRKYFCNDFQEFVCASYLY
jgi:hypothetical protein